MMAWLRIWLARRDASNDESQLLASEFQLPLVCDWCSVSSTDMLARLVLRPEATMPASSWNVCVPWKMVVVDSCSWWPDLP